MSTTEKIPHAALMDPVPDVVLLRLQEQFPQTHDALTPQQLLDIRSAVKGGANKKRHWVSLQGVVPLIFRKWYFTFYFGVDHRSDTQQAQTERRQAFHKFKAVFFMTFLTLCLASFFILLFFLIHKLGLNSFPQPYRAP